MGLIKAALGAAGGVLADQWKEYFYCEALPSNVIAVKGRKKVSGRSSNNGSDNIISNGSVISVADGQCMLIVEQGKVVDLCAEPGEYTYDSSTEPSVFSGNLGSSIAEVFKNVCKRFTFGGEAPKDQRIYYFNTKEMPGMKYGTPNPVPFRVVDNKIGLDVDIAIRCFGEYSVRVSNPLLFYTNVCGNVIADYTVDRLENQMRSELLTALQPAFARISEQGVRYSAIPAHTTELADALRDRLLRRVQRQGQRRGRGHDQGGPAQRHVPRSHHGRGSPGRRAGGCHAGRRKERRRRSHGLHGHEHGPERRRRQRAEPLSDGRPAGAVRSRRPRRGQLEVRLRLGQHRQILPEVRREEARSDPGGQLEVCLRLCQHRQFLPAVRREEARRGPLSLRQVRLGAGGSGQSPQILP